MAEVDSELLQQLENRAVALLAIREHGRKELKYKLLQKLPEAEKQPGLVDFALDELEEKGWLSEARFIERYVQQACEKGQGPYKIRQALQQRSDANELIEAHLAMDDDDWAEFAGECLFKKYGERIKPTQPKEQARRMRFLQSRGFSQAQIWKAFQSA
ncbi:MAG: RecX family transcriptional regulator [Piscirickettsiaceae bacterium CG_4_9_14_3_um_filter_43_564]|nr:regulatory protein RecX [Thiomicrospira sp.]OIP93772.1 MAG: RecX family transcriptional regulator [Thiomicrospira sp. CG2_30_44_34]PIQ06394.1 MAG: RecX family transcriptional regulator [Piscirickettsiaceae bacterium CG18_big_fil_WC_8_21_14_2_50_44_103]PIU37863.1 MAG: RecX family transcriptional regulator [Piscirickettsiaceae bacterium CG07_land_8_20_14_0_80_44_28]PIW57235.1 MAG: RecX family transcriptional regulator [Piscirickettsiaceae bacterium CG12_big_fil_rev_8_21_14_0_65_44_934]PIW7791